MHRSPHHYTWAVQALSLWAPAAGLLTVAGGPPSISALDRGHITLSDASWDSFFFFSFSFSIQRLLSSLLSRSRALWHNPEVKGHQTSGSPSIIHIFFSFITDSDHIWAKKVEGRRLESETERALQHSGVTLHCQGARWWVVPVSPGAAGATLRDDELQMRNKQMWSLAVNDFEAQAVPHLSWAFDSRCCVSSGGGKCPSAPVECWSKMFPLTWCWCSFAGTYFWSWA